MRYVVIALLFFLFLGGCGRVPEPSTYEYTNQLKLQAGHHWDVLATDIANEINNALILGDYVNAPVFVRETCGDDNNPCKKGDTSLFNETFRDLLITRLVNLGVPTITTPTPNSIEVKYKAQQVYHRNKGLRTVRPGLLTALTAGVIVLRNAPGEIAALATAGAIDAANASFNSISHFEIVITTSMTVKEKYLYRNTNIYYINDQDSWHYLNPGKPAEIALTSGNMPVVEPVEEAPFAPKPEEQAMDISAPADASTGI